ncbi:hypothetical protein PsYK624_122090 [Phanerochaete sordida]|uniref:Uncharacterized protein n=1 Tax=Phanerochaete sordida TaxID=48140 RepID=A0A9P3GJN5_9APHY|nr:hypothetical protein PsYK624_122090 [Phanerochaete sordida]
MWKARSRLEGEHCRAHDVTARALTWEAREQYNRRRDASSCSTPTSTTSPSIARGLSLPEASVPRKRTTAASSDVTTSACHKAQHIF